MVPIPWPIPATNGWVPPKPSRKTIPLMTLHHFIKILLDYHLIDINVSSKVVYQVVILLEDIYILEKVKAAKEIVIKIIVKEVAIKKVKEVAIEKVSKKKSKEERKGKLRRL